MAVLAALRVAAGVLEGGELPLGIRHLLRELGSRVRRGQVAVAVDEWRFQIMAARAQCRVRDVGAVGWRIARVHDHRVAEDVAVLAVDRFGVVNVVLAGKSVQRPECGVVRDLVAQGAAHTVHGRVVQRMARVQYAAGTEQRDIAALYLRDFVIRHRRVALGALVVDDVRQMRIAFQFGCNLGLPERVLGRVRHHGRAPVPDDGHVVARRVRQAVVAHGTVARTGKVRRGEVGVLCKRHDG